MTLLESLRTSRQRLINQLGWHACVVNAMDRARKDGIRLQRALIDDGIDPLTADEIDRCGYRDNRSDLRRQLVRLEKRIEGLERYEARKESA